MIAIHASRSLPTRVPFHGGEIIAVAGATPDATLVVLAPIAAALGLDWSAQLRRLRPTDLFDYLRNHGWIYRRHGRGNHIGYQDRTKASLLEHRVTTIQRPDGTEKMVEQVLITPRGVAHLSALLPGGPR